MMYRPTEEEERMMEKVDKYLVLSVEKGGYYLPDDAPEEIKRLHKKVQSIYTLDHFLGKAGHKRK